MHGQATMITFTPGRFSCSMRWLPPGVLLCLYSGLRLRGCPTISHLHPSPSRLLSLFSTFFCVFVRLCNPFPGSTYYWTSPGRYFMVEPAPNHGRPGRGTVLWDDGGGGGVHIRVACRRREGQRTPEAKEEPTPTDESMGIDWGP